MARRHPGTTSAFRPSVLLCLLLSTLMFSIGSAARLPPSSFTRRSLQQANNGSDANPSCPTNLACVTSKVPSLAAFNPK